MNYTTIIVVVIILVGIFLIGRELVLWYFRINYREDQLNKIIKLLTEIDNKLGSR